MTLELPAVNKLYSILSDFKDIIYWFAPAIKWRQKILVCIYFLTIYIMKVGGLKTKMVFLQLLKWLLHQVFKFSGFSSLVSFLSPVACVDPLHVSHCLFT